MVFLNLKQTIYIGILTLSASMSLFLGIFVFIRKRDSKGAVNFILSMLLATLWSVGNALELSSFELVTKLFFANMQYIAYCYSPVTLLALCMEFTGYDKWVRNGKILWLFALPSIIIILVFTDPFHGLMRYDLHLNSTGLFTVIAKKYGPVFYIHSFYSHILNFTSMVLLIRGVYIKNTVYYRQASSLLLGISMIVISNIIYIFKIGPITGLDITPIFFGPVGMVLAWAIFHFKLFDLVPIARAIVIENMDSGYMVLDLQDRILDINKTFQNFIKGYSPNVLSKQVQEVCREIPELVRVCTDRDISHTEISIDSENTTHYYEVLLSPIINIEGNYIGRLLVLNDETQKKLEQLDFLNQQKQMVILKERANHARDIHDNLGQILGFINLQAQGIQKELMKADIDVGLKQLSKLVDVTQNAQNDMRAYIQEVHSSSCTHQRDFVCILNELIESFKSQTGINVILDIPCEFISVSIVMKAQDHMLNIIRESLNNIRKHANSTQVKIKLRLTNDEISFSIQDNGVGFNDTSTMSGPLINFGLNNIMSRAAEIGGIVSINSIQGEGTRLEFSGPNKEVLMI